jgi:hypothetical protein
VNKTIDFFTHKQTANPLRKCKIAGTETTNNFVKNFRPLKVNHPINSSAEDSELKTNRHQRFIPGTEAYDADSQPVEGGDHHQGFSGLELPGLFHAPRSSCHKQ